MSSEMIASITKKQTSYTLRPALIEQIKREADKQGRSASNLVEFLLDRALNGEEGR
jgi:hypothetical protein